MTWRRFLLFPLLFVVIGMLSLLRVAKLSAQGETFPSPPGTLPSGTVYLPIISSNVEPTPPPVFDAIPVEGAPIDRPAAIHGDLNLSLRGYVTTTSDLNLIDHEGPTDSDAPQIAAIFSPPRLPQFVGVYRVNDWNWNCGDNGCRGLPLTDYEVTLLEMETSPGEAIAIPSRNQRIYDNSTYKVLVLYAEATRITLVYRRSDTPAFGYVVHMEDIAVEPTLVALYQQLNEEGRSQLPALRNGERLGRASGASMKIAVRDTGTFMDPRVRKDWWLGY